MYTLQPYKALTLNPLHGLELMLVLDLWLFKLTVCAVNLGLGLGRPPSTFLLALIKPIKSS